MLTSAILVNGVPASGKSTVSRDISRALGAPLLGLDTVKEALFGELGAGDRLYNRTMGRASFAAIWALVGAFPPGSVVVIDAWFGFQPVEFLTEHVKAAKAVIACELWCHTDPRVIERRYLDRCERRHAGHLGPEYAPELRALAERAQPIGLSPVIQLDTEKAVDTAWLVRAVKELLPIERTTAHSVLPAI
ncbi:AAA family ATPase [Acidisoma cellulosilytica]|uniref:AAA family ATPase n=1 Tax=Acidisoma cellulosilyticum TaxID=2802395 RepID=A0A963Z3R8_9PROT|nr:AAA family ATPase [Acidisoma cellulosilyticum]MCB8882274.1 AAA family ATPase [Acidisoma cellulosilyticum]